MKWIAAEDYMSKNGQVSLKMGRGNGKCLFCKPLDRSMAGVTLTGLLAKEIHLSYFFMPTG